MTPKTEISVQKLPGVIRRNCDPAAAQFGSVWFGSVKPATAAVSGEVAVEAEPWSGS